MGSGTNAYGLKETTAQQVLPIVGSVVGGFFGPGGSEAGRGIGEGIGNTIATGDAAGAPQGTEAAAETDLGGLFSGQGVEGFLGNYLAPQILGGPGAGEGGGSLGFLQGILGAQSGAGDYPVGGTPSATGATSATATPAAASIASNPGSPFRMQQLGAALLGANNAQTTGGTTAGTSSTKGASPLTGLAGNLLSNYLSGGGTGSTGGLLGNLLGGGAQNYIDTGTWDTSDVGSALGDVADVGSEWV